VVLPFCLLNAALRAAPLPEVEGLTWEELRLTSTFDGAEQPIVVGVPDTHESGRPTPLLVALHTWSYGYRQEAKQYGPEAAGRGWLLVLPHFRGPNLATTPQATKAGGSLAAQHDIIDAVEHMQRTYTVDAERVYLSGSSGGGHMALLMAGKYPDLWGAVCAWCPITDLAQWHAQGNRYAQHIEAVCGGLRGASPEVDFEYLRRSPRTFITNAADTAILLGHGDRDPTIDPEQSWRTFLRLRDVPQHRTVFRSWSAGHAGLASEGLDWAAERRRSQHPPRDLQVVTDEAKWYFWVFAEPSAPLELGRVRASAGPGPLVLEVENLARVGVDLNRLQRHSPSSLDCDGRPIVGGAVDRDGGKLMLALEDGGRHTLSLE
jgi:poly(3-hydroxybutyrate) depolymerase